MEQGLIHIYCGDGKGKTSAAIGLAVRAAGSGLKVLFTRFLKNESSGELAILDDISQIKVLHLEKSYGFFKNLSEEKKQEVRETYLQLWRAIELEILTGRYDVLVIDEFMAAYKYDLIPKEEAIEFLEKKPKELEIVLTGRNPDEKLVELADYVSEIKKVIGKTRSGLQMGYTTGSCAAAAAKAAAEMLLSGEEIRQVRLLTPKGIELYLELEEIMRKKSEVSCAVRKYSGDDPDVTNGILVYATVQKVEKKSKINSENSVDLSEKINLDGGIGIGRVTKPGLEQKIGQAAINKVPRRMICEAVEEVCRKYEYTGNLQVRLSVPEGAEVAKKTFNPRLGIEGGISILGTTGIVEPMSEKALTDTIYLEMKMLKENGTDWCYVVPGNYGMDFLRKKLHVDTALSVKCSNYVGETIEDAKLLGMKGILLIGHIGKFIKLAAGVMNTHSRQADCRMEVLGVHAAMNDADAAVVREIMDCINTTEAMEILRREKLIEPVMESVMKRIEFFLKNRAGEELEIGVILFSTEDGILGKSENADELLKKIQENR